MAKERPAMPEPMTRKSDMVEKRGWQDPPCWQWPFKDWGCPELATLGEDEEERSDWLRGYKRVTSIHVDATCDSRECGGTGLLR